MKLQYTSTLYIYFSFVNFNSQAYTQAAVTCLNLPLLFLLTLTQLFPTKQLFHIFPSPMWIDCQHLRAIPAWVLDWGFHSSSSIAWSAEFFTH